MYSKGFRNSVESKSYTKHSVTILAFLAEERKFFIEVFSRLSIQKTHKKLEWIAPCVWFDMVQFWSVSDVLYFIICWIIDRESNINLVAPDGKETKSFRYACTQVFERDTLCPNALTYCYLCKIPHHEGIRIKLNKQTKLKVIFTKSLLYH